MVLKKLRHVSLIVVLAILMGLAFSLVSTDNVSAATAGTCQTVTVKARLAPLLPKNLDIVGDLCVPTAWAEGERRVDVLVHGGSYNRSYWDFPVSYPDYSYVDRALAAGRATFAYDRLGVGDSSRPLSALVTLQADAYVLHQIITWARANEQDLDKVTIIGHSLGSITVIEEAGTYNDADAVIVTGLLHSIGPGVVPIFGAFSVAALDPKFAGHIFDPGYLTTTPGQRGVFYGGTVDPAVVAYDEINKDVAASLTVAGGSATLLPSLLNKSASITSHVLLVSGDLDMTFCGITLSCSDPAAILAHETPYYNNAASLQTRVIADTGHNLALHPSASTSFDAINQWILAH